MKEIAQGTIGIAFLIIAIGFVSFAQPARRQASAHPFRAPQSEPAKNAASASLAYGESYEEVTEMYDPNESGSSYTYEYVYDPATQTTIETYESPLMTGTPYEYEYVYDPVTQTETETVTFADAPTDALPAHGDIVYTTYAPVVYTPMYDVAIVYEPQPWYYRAFPGWGSTISNLLPALFRPEPVAPPTIYPTCDMSVYPNAIRRGAQATLAWYSHNASVATLSGIGSVYASDSRLVAPATSGTYTLTVWSPTGHSYSCSAYIAVF